MKPTVEEIKQLLKYEDGFVYHRADKRGTSIKAGGIAMDSMKGGGKSGGYKVGAISGFKGTYRTHIVIWAMHNGRWPLDGMEIDHINHNATDNRIENLREVSRIEQCRNMTMNRTNTSGHAGVSYRKDKLKWRAYIMEDNKQINLGHFYKLEDAIAARKKAEVEMGFHPNHGKAAV